MPVSSIHSGWRYAPADSRLDFYYRGTRIGHINATQLVVATGGINVTGGITAVTGGITDTAGPTTVTASDLRVTAGNLRLGAISTFATTEPTSAAVFKLGTAPVGAITTSGALFTDGTVIRKIIAAGTASNVET